MGLNVYAKQVFEDGQTLIASDLNTIADGIVDANIDNYIHAQPKSIGHSNTIKRARQLTDVLWTPTGGNIPGKYKINGVYTDFPFKPGITYRGVPYEGGAINTYTYVGLNINLDTFITAVHNPNSIIYNYDSNHQKGGAYYGTVCSKFAQYCLNLPCSFNTNNIPNIESLETIALPGEYHPEDIKLCDILVNTSSHTVICTDLLYDRFGKLLYVEISEATTPVCRRLLWSVDECYTKWIETYRLCRLPDEYFNQELIPFDERDYVNVNTSFYKETKENVPMDYALMPEKGDKCNYSIGKTNTCHILKKGYKKAIVKRDGEIISEVNIDDSTKSFKFDSSVAGLIEMYLEKEDGEKSTSVYASINTATVTVTNSLKYNSGSIDVSYSCSSGKPIYIQFGSGQSEFCRLDGMGRSIIHSDNTATLIFDKNRASKSVRVACQNDFGTYYSNTISFTIEEVGTDENLNESTYLNKANFYNNYGLESNNPSPVSKSNYRVYGKIPVEANTIYNVSGAKSVWFYKPDGESIKYQQITEDTITTPPLTSSMSLEYDSSTEMFSEQITKIRAIDSNNDILISSTSAQLCDNINLSSSSYEDIDNEAYFTYKMIPVIEGRTYYTRCGSRSWYLDEKGVAKETLNIKNNEIPYVFTVPSGISYISISYSKTTQKSVAEITYIREIDNFDVNTVDCD